MGTVLISLFFNQLKITEATNGLEKFKRLL
jgi:hypothetical protein